MTRKTILTLALVAASLIPAGCQGTVETPIGPFVWDFTNLPKAYKDLEEALATCLGHYTDAILAGDLDAAAAWEDLIQQIKDIKDLIRKDAAPAQLWVP